MKKVFENFEDFNKNRVFEARELESLAKPIDVLKSLYPDAPLIDIAGRDIEYNKRSQSFNTTEKTLGVDPRKVGVIILYNSKRDNGVVMEPQGKYHGKKDFRASPAWLGSIFVTKDSTPRARHRLWIEWNNPDKMDHYDQMNLGYHGSLD